MGIFQPFCGFGQNNAPTHILYNIKYGLSSITIEYQTKYFCISADTGVSDFAQFYFGINCFFVKKHYSEK